MSLQTLAVGIKEDAERVRDRNRLIRDVEEYATLEQEFNELAGQLRLVVGSVDVLRAAGIQVPVTALPEASVASLRALTPEGTALVEAPAAASKGAIRDLKAWADRSSMAAKDAYQAWADSVLGDLDGAERFGEQLGKIGVDGGIKIRALVASARARRRTLPKSASEAEEVKRIGQELEQATQAVAPTKETRDFIRAVLESGAPLELLTDDVKQWAKDRGLWSSLRVRLSGDAHG